MNDQDQTQLSSGNSGGGWASSIGFFFDRIIAILNAIGTGWIFVMMMMIVADVFMRFVFNSPIRGVPLIITMSIIAIVFLQLADALRAGRLTRSDMLIGSLLANRPKLGYSMQGLFHLAGVFIMSVLLWYSVPFMLKAWRLNTYDGTDGEFTLPEWPVKAVIVVGAIVCAIQFCRHLLRDIETLRNLGNQP
jgi:TRAP-type mannitol/chloroaromatic compound transport system permease small subunit